MASPPRFAYLDLENSQNQNNTKTKSNNEIPAGASSFMEVLTPTTFSLALESNAGIDCFGNERNALANQAKFFNNQLLSDITLVVVKKKYFCHKLILVKSSDVFERMFSSDWDKSQRKVSPFFIYNSRYLLDEIVVNPLDCYSNTKFLFLFNSISI